MIVLLTATPGRSAGAGRVQALQTRQRRAERLPPTTARRQRESQRHAVESGGGRLPQRQHLGAQHLLLLPARRARWEPHRCGERLGGPDVQGCRTGASEPRRQSCGSRPAVRRVARHGGRRRARFGAYTAAATGRARAPSEAHDPVADAQRRQFASFFWVHDRSMRIALPHPLTL